LSHTVQSGDEDVRTKHLIGITVSLSVLCLVLSSLWLRAQAPLSPNPDSVDALWVAHSDGLRKVSATDGTMLLDMAEAQDARAVAVDGQRGVLWAYRASALWAYRFNGTPVISIRLAQQGDNGNSQDVALGWLPLDTMSRIS
jgi:hypothetical protein